MVVPQMHVSYASATSVLPDAVERLMTLAEFVASRFIPNHVQLKSRAGRTHYHAILKHVITPDLVDRLFVPYHGETNGRLKPLPGWPYLDHVKISEITPEHVRRLTTCATARGYSGQTVKHIRNVISAILNHAQREKMFSGENPASMVDLPAAPPKYWPRLSLLQANAILNLLESPEQEIALITMETGLKMSEICALQWKHINLGRSRAYVDGVILPPGVILVTRHWMGREIVGVAPGKARGVALTPSLSRLLLKLKERKNMARPDSPLISSRDGDPIAPSQVRIYRLKPIGRSLGMPWISWQVFKRTREMHVPELDFSPANICR